MKVKAMVLGCFPFQCFVRMKNAVVFSGFYSGEQAVRRTMVIGQNCYLI